MPKALRVESLNDSSSLVHGAFTASAIGMAVTALDLTIVQSNGALEALLGRRAAELTGHRLSDFAHPEDRAATQRHDDAVRAAPPADSHTERRIIRPDGTAVWIDLTASVLRTAEGHPRHLLLQAIDITAHKAAEADLERERRRLTDAQALAHVGSWEWNLDTDEVVWSEELAAIFGHAIEDTAHKPSDWMGTVHPDDVEQVNRAVDEAMNLGSTENEYRIIRPDGEVRWLLGHRRGIDGLGGRRMVGTIQDITERRREEERRRDAEALLAEAIEHAPMGVGVLGVDGGFLTVNPALCALTGFSELELLTRNFVELVHPDAMEHALAQRTRMLAGEIDRYEGEQPCRTRSGDTLWVLLSIGSLRGPAGDVRAFIVQIQDATLRRAAEQALRDSERAALEASRMKSQFLANMSHEIRTPMNGVLGMIDALLHSDLTEEQQRHAETARRSAESLLTIIDDVLDFSKIEAGRLELEAEAIDLVELTGELRHLLWPRAQARGLRLIVTLDAAVPDVVLGDPVRLRQILVNLITNAIKFSEDGEIVLTIEPDARGPHALRRRRSGHRDRRRHARPPVRAVHAGRRVDDAALRRDRPRPGDQPAARGADGRRDGCDVAPGRRQHLPLHGTAAGDRRRRPSPAVARHPRAGGHRRAQPGRRGRGARGALGRRGVAGHAGGCRADAHASSRAWRRHRRS